MNSIVSIRNLSKTYDNGYKALSEINLDIREGEILALLGPNGAGKTTLISIICGIARATGGSVTVGGHDIEREYRQSRSLIGLVPQELHTDSFESIWNTVSFSRGLFGKRPDPEYVEGIIRELSLIEKKDNQIMQLSGGMKRRVMIAKALSHEPRILFLDEPTAGVDVELRKDMWKVVERLRRQGVTIILTTHYIEEAEAIADRIAVINRGKLLLVEEKRDLMEKLGKKVLFIHLVKPVDTVPGALSKYALTVGNGGLVYHYDTAGSGTGITGLLNDLNKAGLKVRDLETRQSSLEDIFVGLVARDGEDSRSNEGNDAEPAKAGGAS